MKFAKFSKGLLLGLALVLATGAFAASNKGSLEVVDPVTVSGKQLHPGDYSVKWDGSWSERRVEHHARQEGCSHNSRPAHRSESNTKQATLRW